MHLALFSIHPKVRAGMESITFTFLRLHSLHPGRDMVYGLCRRPIIVFESTVPLWNFRVGGFLVNIRIGMRASKSICEPGSEAGGSDRIRRVTAHGVETRSGVRDRFLQAGVCLRNSMVK